MCCGCESSVISELIETCGHACNAFLKAEMALNDGDLQLSQKFTKEGQVLVNALKTDTFLEMKEFFVEQINEVNDYDYPCSMELIKALNEVNMNAGSYLAVHEEENGTIGKNIAIKNLLKSINTVVEIYTQMFEN